MIRFHPGAVLSFLVASLLPNWASGEEKDPRSHFTTQWFGVSRAEQMLARGSEATTLRGIERLGSMGTPRALAALAALVTDGGPWGARGRLATVRALAPHVRDPIALRALVRLMVADGGGSPDDQLAPWARASAAMALAKGDRPAAWDALRQAIGTEGPLGEAAAAAILAHPPRDVADLLGGRRPDTVGLVDTLGALGDQRAFLAVRAAVTAGPPEVRARAAVALTRLGAFETIPLARHWLAQETNPRFWLAAAEILSLAHAVDAPAAIAQLADDEAAGAAWLALARSSPHPQHAPRIVAALSQATGEERASLFATLGRCGGEVAITALAAALRVPDDAGAAAYALALSAGEGAEEVLVAALSEPATQRLAARAAVVRTGAFGRMHGPLARVLEELLAGSNPADRAVAAWGLAALDVRRGAELLRAEDPVVVTAAARAALVPELALVAAERLEQERNPQLRTALAISLAMRDGRARVSTASLVGLVTAGGAAAPLAVRALTARGDPNARAQVERLLESDVIEIRAHAALGLGDSPLPSAMGRLESAYRFEPDAGVRYALVVALGRRPEAARARPLRLAADLDVDERVRVAARAALAGQGSSLEPAGRGSLWARVGDSTGGPTTAVALSVRLPNGLALPALPDPDGFVTLVGLPPGAVRLRLAELPRSDNPGTRDAYQGPRPPDPRPQP